MSATHGAAQPAADAKIFPAPAQRAAALDDGELQRRIFAVKPARLCPPVKGDRAALAAGLAGAAAKALRDGHRRVAVMVNRVATAQAVTKMLRGDPEVPADVVLMTGRMRPLDRDDLVGRWEPKLRAAEKREPLNKPVVVVTTQCLEVGADFDFDALVTECASLDALRQRFGRLNRLGRAERCAAAVLILESDTKGKKPDPIYGEALAETWKWLEEIAAGAGEVDFGIAAMDQALARLRESGRDREARLYPPAEHAPVLLPAHLDMLCQTGPRPAVEPEPALFLHGPQTGPPEARVIWRAGLAAESGGDGDERLREIEERWQQNLKLLPPSALEALTVPLQRLRKWLAGPGAPDEDGDVEGRGEAEATGPEGRAAHAFGIWRPEKGGAGFRLTQDPGDIRPGDTVVLRAEAGGAGDLGQLPPEENAQGLGPGKLDLAERAARAGRGWVMLRAQREVLEPFKERPGIKALLALAEEDEGAEANPGDIEAALSLAAGEEKGPDGEALAPLPKWFGGQLHDLADGLGRVEPLPGGGLLLTAKKRQRPEAVEGDEDADTEAGSSRSGDPVTLRAHTAAVRRCAQEQAARCLPQEMTSTLALAAEHHDLGKLDRRFQLLLHDGEPSEGEPLAKSARVLRSWRRPRVLAAEDELPAGFRHEMLSLAIAQAVETDLEPGPRDLALHLIASHHGYARPFAPVVVDSAPQAAEIEAALTEYFASGGPAPSGPAPVLDSLPAHHLASGVADRFWRLTRRHGWWGLAYFDAILRLADWQASSEDEGDEETQSQTPSAGRPAVRWAGPRQKPKPAELELAAIDGANPLGFLAALGTLRLLELTDSSMGVRLAWARSGTAWRPKLFGPADRADVLRLLAAAPWAPAAAMSAAMGLDLTVTPRAFRAFAVTAAGDRLCAAFAAAFGSDACVEERLDRIERTPFCFITGSGHQHFLGTIAALALGVTPDHLTDALFGEWRADRKNSMRWDPADAAEYALRAVDPGPEGAEAVWGANRLAIEALPLFATAPASR
ncbi:MAG: type I-G CRISPR-associated helicase/endonuclease Cas3g, partial [Terriglobales bacterium]